MKRSVLLLALALLGGWATAAAAERIAFISDLNGRYGSVGYDERVSSAVGRVVSLQPDLVVSTGDMVAGQKQPQLDTDHLDRMWAGFNRVVTDPLRRAGIPFVVTPGNHDASAYPDFELERERYRAQWAGLQPELKWLGGSDWPRRYAARMGGVLLVAFDGTRPGSLPESERAFLERMLSSYSNGATATIVFSHLPMWPFAQGREHEIIDDPGLLELLHRYGVDVYASGHHHVFYAGADTAGMLHVSIGALGGNARPFSGDRERQPHSFAVLDIEDGMLNVQAFPGPEFVPDAAEDFGPAAVDGPLGQLHRVDGPVALRR